MRSGESSPFNTATLTWTMQCAPSSVQRICRFLAMRWLTTELTALDGLLKFTGVVADHGNALVGRHTVSSEKLIQPRCSRGNFPVRIGIELWRPVGERRSSGNEVDVATKSPNGVAMPQPCRVDTNGRDMPGFANLDACVGSGSSAISRSISASRCFPIVRIRLRVPLNEMPLSSGSTSFSMAVACRYGRWLAHFAWRYSNSGVARLVSALDRGWTTDRSARTVRWQAHDHSRGLFTVTLPYTVRTTVERLSLWLKAAPQHRQ